MIIGNTKKKQYGGFEAIQYSSVNKEAQREARPTYIAIKVKFIGDGIYLHLSFLEVNLHVPCLGCHTIRLPDQMVVPAALYIICTVTCKRRPAGIGMV